MKELNKDCEFVIYGAGNIGIHVYKWMRLHNYKVKYFIVTSLKSSSCIEEGIDIYPLYLVVEELKNFKTQVIVAGNLKNRAEMVKELYNRNINNYMVITDAIYKEIRCEVLKDQAEAWRESHKVNNRNIGWISPGYRDSVYAEKRNIISVLKDVEYIPLPKEVEYIPCVGTSFENQIEIYTMIQESCYAPTIDISDIDMIHTFNMICKTDRPWCATFETILPRVFERVPKERERYLELVEYLLADNCKAIFPISQNAYDIQKRQLYKKIDKKKADIICNKMFILHPPQKILISDIEVRKKFDRKKLHFLFIGNGFFCKGGKELVEVLDSYAQNYDFKLTIISSLWWEDAYSKTTQDEMLECKQYLEETPWIDFRGALTNDEVLSICKKATVGFLPSYWETYGYVVLELQASGCPVVTTNIRAFTEINNEACGWICKLPLNEEKYCAVGINEARELLKKELHKVFDEIFDDTSILEEKGRLSINRIKEMHSPEKYEKQIKAIWENAIGET